MNNHITFSQVCRMLDAQKMAYEVLALGNDWKAIITQYSGRLLGPFKGENGESMLWVNAALNDEAAFRDFVRERRLHLGGERLWVNPELKFYCQAPELFDATYTVQPEIDPGDYALERQGDNVFLRQETTLKDLNEDGEKRFSISRRYFAAPDPLASVRSLRDIQVDYCGFVQDIECGTSRPRQSSTSSRGCLRRSIPRASSSRRISAILNLWITTRP